MSSKRKTYSNEFKTKIVGQKDFDDTIKEFREIQDVRRSLWDKARKLLLNGYEIEAYILILATWNVADFKYFLTNLNLDEFEKAIKDLNPIFENLKNKTFKEADFERKHLQKDTKQIYGKLKGIVRQTGASKMMALKNQNLFVMWDTKIRKMYKINDATPEDYINFLQIMKKKFEKIKYQDKKIPLAKAIDEYNYVKANGKK